MKRPGCFHHGAENEQGGRMSLQDVENFPIAMKKTLCCEEGDRPGVPGDKHPGVPAGNLNPRRCGCTGRNLLG